MILPVQNKADNFFITRKYHTKKQYNDPFKDVLIFKWVVIYIYDQRHHLYFAVNVFLITQTTS